MAQLHQVPTEANRYRGRVGDLDIARDHQWTKPMETLYHLLGLVVGHAVDPDRVDPRSGEVLSAEDGQPGLVRHQDRLLIEPEQEITQNFSFLSLDVGETHQYYETSSSKFSLKRINKCSLASAGPL